MAGVLSQAVKRQIRTLSRDQSAFVFGKKEHVKEFTWDELWDMLSRKLLLLAFFLKKLVKDVDSSKPVICLIISMLLKKQNRKMCLLQNVISVLLYGNGSAKQVGHRCACLCCIYGPKPGIPYDFFRGDVDQCIGCTIAEVQKVNGERWCSCTYSYIQKSNMIGSLQHVATSV